MFSFFDLVFYGCFVHFVAMRDKGLARRPFLKLTMKEERFLSEEENHEKKHRNVFGCRVFDADGRMGCW